MGTTTAWQIPYPELTDPPDGASQIKANAQRVDACLTTVQNAINSKPPYALAAGTISISLSNEAYKAGTVSMPGRFTQTPLLVVTSYGNVSYYPYSAGASPTSWNIGLAHRDNSPATVSLTAHWHAIQMTSAAAPGTLQTPEPPTHIATCHTDSCPAAGVPNPIITEPPNSVWCGYCGQEITDIIAGRLAD